MERHYELHLVLSHADPEIFALSGLPIADTENCANCGTEIGTHRKFTPYAIVLTGDGSHFLCLSCAAPVIRPRS